MSSSIQSLTNDKTYCPRLFHGYQVILKKTNATSMRFGNLKFPENPFGLEIELFKRREQHNADGYLHPICASFKTYVMKYKKIAALQHKTVHRNCLPDSRI